MSDYRSNMDDAELSDWFDGQDWGGLMASGEMDIEDAWMRFDMDAYEEKQRRKEWEESEDYKRERYILKGIILEGYVPSKEDEIKREQVIEDYKRRQYVVKGIILEGYVPSEEDEIKREEMIEYEKNPIEIPF
jgi:hypothetical protein